MNKNSKLVMRLRYTYQPFHARVLLDQLLGFGRIITTRVPISAGSTQLSRDPVFIVSAGHFGTTLLRSMLVAGGQIAIPTETQIIHKLAVLFNTTRSMGWEDHARLIIAAFESHRYFPLWQVNLSEAYKKVLVLPKNERSLARIIDEVYLTYAAQAFPGAIVWGDQSPLHTFYLPDINRIFPKTRYIHMLRDGRDVTSSLVVRFGDDHLFESVLRWKTSLNRIKHFKKIILPAQFLEIRYEALMTDPKKVLQQVCQFTTIDFSPVMLDYWKLPSTIEHKYEVFHKNLEKPVFNSSIGKWKEKLNPNQ